MKKIQFGIYAWLLCASTSAQFNVLTSPVINNDSTVTFRINAPNAKHVEVKGQFKSGSTPLVKEEKGIWSATVKIKRADIYPYNFIVDGVPVADPGNKLVFPNESFKSSLLEIPNANALYTVNKVPHGKVHYCTYFSRVLNEHRNVLVYTPAEYDLSPQKQYPVFYLISGTTDTEETWFKAGRANTILDNLIARSQAEPMIVVMPYGYMNNGTPRPSTMKAGEMYDTFAREMTECIMPYVEKNYRTINDRDYRAIGGFSRGGGQSMFTALKHPDRFGWLGSFSAYLTPEVMEKYIPNLKEKANSLNMLWFCVGTGDFLYKDVVHNMEYFDKMGIEYEHITRKGGHTWMHARYCLAETYKKLFRNKRESKDFPGMMIDSGSLPGYSIYYPTDFKERAAISALPVFVFGNGGCSHCSAEYLPLFNKLVKNGYIVIAIGTIDGKLADIPQDFAMAGREDNLLDAVDWICKQNAQTDSEFYHTVDCHHIAVSGHSCGGAQAIAASYDPRIKSTIVLNAGMGKMEMAGASAKSLKNFHHPVLYLIGGPKDIAYKNAALDFDSINHVPIVSANFPVGHGGTYTQPEGGLFGEITLMWLDWQLKGKETSSKFFLNSKWRKKNYPQCDYEMKGF